MQRGLHNITDELSFANHEGYIFHDSLGLESPWLLRELVDWSLGSLMTDRATGLGPNDATRRLGLGMFFFSCLFISLTITRINRFINYYDSRHAPTLAANASRWVHSLLRRVTTPTLAANASRWVHFVLRHLRTLRTLTLAPNASRWVHFLLQHVGTPTLAPNASRWVTSFLFPHNRPILAANASRWVISFSLYLFYLV